MKVIFENSITHERKEVVGMGTVRASTFNKQEIDFEPLSNTAREYYEKYPDVEQYDKMLDIMTNDLKKEYYKNLKENYNKVARAKKESWLILTVDMTQEEYVLLTNNILIEKTKAVKNKKQNKNKEE